MTRDESRRILDAHTLAGEGADGVDRDLVEAMALLKQDAVLNEWYAKRRLGDERIAQALKGSAPPHGLRERLLNLETQARSARPAWLRRELILALAAGVVVGVSVVFWRMVHPAHPAATTWQSDALAQVKQLDNGKLPLDWQSSDLAAIKAFLEGKGSPVPGNLPAQLIANPRVGCKTIEVKGLRAAIVCFELSPGLLAHLVVLDVGPEVSSVPVGHPVFAHEGKWSTASWSDGKKSYMLGTRADMDELKSLFG